MTVKWWNVFLADAVSLIPVHIASGQVTHTLCAKYFGQHVQHFRFQILPVNAPNNHNGNICSPSVVRWNMNRLDLLCLWHRDKYNLWVIKAFSKLLLGKFRTNISCTFAWCQSAMSPSRTSRPVWQKPAVQLSHEGSRNWGRSFSAAAGTGSKYCPTLFRLLLLGDCTSCH